MGVLRIGLGLIRAECTVIIEVLDFFRYLGSIRRICSWRVSLGLVMWRIRMKVLRRDGGAEGRGQIANLYVGD